jgi:anti-anti-sigma factor
MPVHFSVEVERLDQATVIAVHGEADLATVPEFATHLWRAVDARERRIVVDLCDTRFVDSKMVEVLLAAAGRVRRDDGEFAISSATESVRRVLELCGVARMLPMRPTREEALAALAGAGSGDR